MKYLNKDGTEIQAQSELSALLDDITGYLLTLTREERIEWFRRTQYPHPINFKAEIDGTIYTVNAHFDSEADESLQEKAQRIILKSPL